MLQNDFSHFELLKIQGYSPEQICVAAENQGLDFCTKIRVLRKVFNLTLLQAKEVIIVVNHQRYNNSIKNKNRDEILSEHYQIILESLKKTSPQ